MSFPTCEKYYWFRDVPYYLILLVCVQKIYSLFILLCIDLIYQQIIKKIRKEQVRLHSFKNTIFFVIIYITTNQTIFFLTCIGVHIIVATISRLSLILDDDISIHNEMQNEISKADLEYFILSLGFLFIILERNTNNAYFIIAVVIYLIIIWGPHLIEVTDYNRHRMRIAIGGILFVISSSIACYYNIEIDLWTVLLVSLMTFYCYITNCKLVFDILRPPEVIRSLKTYKEICKKFYQKVTMLGNLAYIAVNYWQNQSLNQWNAISIYFILALYLGNFKNNEYKFLSFWHFKLVFSLYLALFLKNDTEIWNSYYFLILMNGFALCSLLRKKDIQNFTKENQQNSIGFYFSKILALGFTIYQIHSDDWMKNIYFVSFIIIDLVLLSSLIKFMGSYFQLLFASAIHSILFFCYFFLTLKFEFVYFIAINIGLQVLDRLNVDQNIARNSLTLQQSIKKWNEDVRERRKREQMRKNATMINLEVMTLTADNCVNISIFDCETLATLTEEVYKNLGERRPVFFIFNEVKLIEEISLKDQGLKNNSRLMMCFV